MIAEGDAHPIGAAWYRLFTGDAPGHGFVGEEIPKLSIAVLPERRRRGVGRELLLKLVERARAAGIPGSDAHRWPAPEAPPGGEERAPDC